MSDWPAGLLQPELTFVSTASRASGVGEIALTIGTWNLLTTGWPAANTALFIPMILTVPFQPQVAAWENGASVTGNIDAGILDSAGVLLGHTGSTAQAGTSTIQTATFSTAPAVLNPGTYYWALVASSTSTLVRSNTSIAAAALRTCGVQQMATDLPLGNATFAAMASAFVPWLTIGGVATL